MGAMNDLIIRFCEVIFPEEPEKQQKMLDAFHLPHRRMGNSPQETHVRRFFERTGHFPRLTVNEISEIVTFRERMRLGEIATLVEVPKPTEPGKFFWVAPIGAGRPLPVQVMEAKGELFVHTRPGYIPERLDTVGEGKWYIALEEKKIAIDQETTTELRAESRRLNDILVGKDVGMTKEQIQELPLGLYRVHWTESAGGGTSLAAVGQTDNGDRWLAPVNWVFPTAKQDVWASIERMEPLNIDDE
jgi:hypothetical protein